MANLSRTSCRKEHSSTNVNSTLLILILMHALSIGAEAGIQQQRQSTDTKRRQQTSSKPKAIAPIFKEPDFIAIDEFRIRREALDKEFRRLGTRSISEIINPFTIRKRGRFYGSVYHYHRNDFFDARNFFDPVGEKLPEFKRNQFGGTLGAFVTERLQVFGTYDGLRINKGSTILSLVPTPSMKKGDFSSVEQALIDPLSGDPFPDNQIPQSRIHPVSARMLHTIPDPNRNDLYRNFVNNQPRVDNRDTITARVDYRLSKASKIFGDYSFSRDDEIDVDPLPEFATMEEGRNQRISLTYTRNFGSSTVLSVNVRYDRHVSKQLSKHSYQSGLLASMGINGVSTLDGADEGYPEMSISGYASLGRYGAPRSSYDNNLGLTANLTYVRNSHKFNYGFEMRNNQINNHRTGGVRRGEFDFDGYFTGDGFADFLLGIPGKATRGMGSDRADLRRRTWRVYVRDDWKINPKFSLSLGLTYNYSPIANSVHNNVSLFWPLVFEPPLDGRIVVTGSREAERAGLGGLKPGQAAYPDKNDWEPSIGLAYSPLGNNRLVIRTSYGLDYHTPRIWRTIDLIGRNYPFYWLESASSPTSPVLDLSDPFRAAVPTEMNIRAIDPRFKSSYIQEWQLTIQNEFLQGWNLEVRYEGRKATRAARSLAANVPLPDRGSIQERRPNPNFGRFRIQSASGSSTGHSFDLEVRRRFTRGFSLRSSFGWNRSFSDDARGDPSNPRNLRAERALSGRSPLRFSLNYLWDLPIGRGQPISADWAGKLRFLLEGWQISGITSMRSGDSFTPRLSGDPNNDGVYGDRPDRIGSGMLPRSERTIDRWFATEDFRHPEVPFGNAGRNILFGPGSKNWDISLIKRTRVTEDGNLIEFRIQFFNAFNHTNFRRPGSTMGTSSFGRISNAGDAREIEIALKYSF